LSFVLPRGPGSQAGGRRESAVEGWGRYMRRWRRPAWRRGDRRRACRITGRVRPVAVAGLPGSGRGEGRVRRRARCRVRCGSRGGVVLVGGRLFSGGLRGVTSARDAIDTSHAEIARAIAQLDQPFPHRAALEQARRHVADLDRQLDELATEPPPPEESTTTREARLRAQVDMLRDSLRYPAT
jgi:hypothetical protein